MRLARLAFACLMPTALTAQQPVSRAAAVEAALLRGARIALGRADTAAARGAVGTARAFPNPTVSGSYTKDPPNYHLLADFRSQHAELLDELLAQSIAGLVHEGLLDVNTVAQDGMRIRASAGTVVRGAVRALASVAAHLRPLGEYELRHPNLDRWRDLRRSLDLRQEARRQQGRFRKDPVAYLAALEDELLRSALPS